jgi:putative tricarboxylic transport membrane protein
VARDKGNLISGLALAAFGIYVISVATRLPYVSEVGPGPGFFPLWIGIGLVLFAAILVVGSVAPAWNLVKGPSSSWASAGRVLIGWVALMLAIALLGRLGFGITFVLLTLFLLIALDRRPPVLAILVGAGLALLFHMLFVVALDVLLPKGLWGF